MAETPEVGKDLAVKESKGEAVAETSSTAVAAREKAAVEARFVMAMNRPRDPDTARQRILKTCRRPRFAETARYKKPVGGKDITGLSVRFAEEIARLWGNLYVQAQIVFDDRERRIYHVVATDLETNTAQETDVIIEKFVERKKVKAGDEVISTRANSYGEKVYLKVATEDEILVKANAAIAKARRNLILTLIPSDIREEAEEEAIDTVKRQDAKDPDAARKRLLDAYFEEGITADQVKELIGKPLEQINRAELQLLRSVYTGLRDGEVTWTEVMEDRSLKRARAQQTETNDKKSSSDLKSKVKQKQKAAAKGKGSATDEESEAIAATEAEEDETIRAEEQAEQKELGA